MTRNDIAFHQAIARASRNMLFVQIVRSFEPLMTVAVPLAWRTRETEADREEVLSRPALIAQAIADRDGANAAALMHAHLDVSIGNLL